MFDLLKKLAFTEVCILVINNQVTLLTWVRSPPKANHLIFGNGLPSKVQESSVVVPVRPEPLVTATCLGAAAKNKKKDDRKLFIYILAYNLHSTLNMTDMTILGT